MGPEFLASTVRGGFLLADQLDSPSLKTSDGLIRNYSIESEEIYMVVTVSNRWDIIWMQEKMIIENI